MKDLDLYAYIDSAAPLQNLTIEPEWRHAVGAFFKPIITAAELVQAYPLDDTLEAAPIFEA